MIDKEKTIKKAISRHGYLYPVRGKHSIEDCFFSLRGETYLMFRTKDKKVHRAKAELLRPPTTGSIGSRETLDSIIKTLNRPIILRSLISKKPVRTCLVNLFPVPGISWSTSTVAASDEKENAELTHSSTTAPVPSLQDRLASVSPVVAPSSMMNGYERTGIEQHALVDQLCSQPPEAAACHYEVLATGYLPISRFTDMLPTPEETPGEGTTTFHYEVLARGYLNRPNHEWQPVDNSGITCYLHERPPLEPETVAESYCTASVYGSDRTGQRMGSV
jgi:hypothetical protein